MAWAQSLRVSHGVKTARSGQSGPAEESLQGTVITVIEISGQEVKDKQTVEDRGLPVPLLHQQF